MSYGIRPPAYRLPDATRLGRVVLQVSDIGISADYYQQVLGLRVLDGGGGPGRVLLAPHGDDRVIVELRGRQGVLPLARPRIGLYHFAVLLPTRADLGAFVRHLADLGMRAGTADHLVSEAVYLQDPDNLGIEVYADRPQGQWKVDGNELAMASDPLDLGSLVAEARGQAWAGMPAGTVLGHVHLHVGDLDEGAAFYHRALGFDKVVWSYPGALFMSAGGYHHHLGTNTWARGGVPAKPDDAQLLEWEVVVPSAADVDAAAASVAGAGGAVERSGATALLRDPWGTAVRLIAG